MFKTTVAVSLFFIALAVAASAQRRAAPRAAKPAATCLNTITKNDWALLLKGASPETVQKLNDDAELRAKQSRNMREMLATACQAEREGYLKDPEIADELEEIRDETIAIEYDRTVNKDKNAAPFASITEKRIEAFYAAPGNEQKFSKYLEEKLDRLRNKGDIHPDYKIKDEERAEAREEYAKISIAGADSRKMTAAAAAKFWPAVRLKVRLQQAQFVLRGFVQKLAERTKPTDDETARYIAAHPELQIEKQKARANEVLERAKKGEDFAELANKYSEDPGNEQAGGGKNGGLYKDVRVGAMVPEFEKAALAVQDGQVYPSVVESDFGYHVIKLEKRTVTKNPAGADEMKYDVRHVLILTMQDDPADPNASRKPWKVFVRDNVEKQKQDELTAKILKDNPVTVAEYAPPAAAVLKPASAAKKPAVPRKRKG